jgi:hypothetical protein
MSLSDLIRKKQHRQPATAIHAISATTGQEFPGDESNHSKDSNRSSSSPYALKEATVPAPGTRSQRAPMVSLSDLRQLQRDLLPHLTFCRNCAVEPHLYCQETESAGYAYNSCLTEFPDAAQRHAEYVAAVIQARIRGLQAGFTALEALAHQKDATGLEQARIASGMATRPAEQAFVNHFTACPFCYPRSGKYCLEGRMLHEAAAREATQ